jgi:hypothetical protein
MTRDGKAQAEEPWSAYSVSKHVDTSNLNAKKVFTDKKKAALLENNIAEFYLYRNGQPVSPSGKIKTTYFPSACISFKFDDTLMLNCGLGKQAGVGVGIKIYRDKFGGSLHANSHNQYIFKWNRSDTAYVNDIQATPVFQSLKLLHKPSFSSNEVVIGEYNAIYQKFYQKRKKNSDQAVTYRVRLIFKSKVTGMDSLKELMQANSSK